MSHRYRRLLLISTAPRFVTVSDGGTTGLGTATASSTGAWSFTTADLSAGSYAFTATDTTSAGTSAASSAFDVTVTPPPPAAPVIGTAAVNPNTDPTVTLTGTAPDGSTVTVSDGGSMALGTTTASSTGTWSFTTPNLPAGTYAFTATDTTSAGTSTMSSPVDVTVPPVSAGTAPVNLVTNGSFETDNFTGWTLGGNYTSATLGPEIFITSQAESGSYAAAMGSENSNGTLSQTLQTTAGQQYTLSFWLANDGGGPNDFTATWNGTPVLALTNTSGQGYTEYSYTVTATGSTSTLEFAAEQNPSQWNLDNISVTAVNPPSGPPTLDSITESPSSGDLSAGKTVTYTLTMSENVTVAGGTPSLTLNDGGTAAYTSGSGTSALTFSYTVAAGQNTPDLMVTAVNLNGGTIQDNAGNAANLSLSGLAQGSPQIDTTAPTVSAVAESPASGDFNAGNTVTLTLAMSENVTVNTAGGTPTLALNDGGTATYVSGSGSNALTFSYTVGASDSNVASLAATTINLNGATIQDGAGNAANLSLTGLTQTGPQIDTTTPVISSIAKSPSSGDLNAGKVVTYTIGMSENVTVNTAGGTPTLALNDGGTATYVSGSGSNALTFSYTVGASDSNVASLAATTINLNGATIQDGAGNAANLSLTGLTQAGPQIDTTTPVISSIAETPSSGDLNAGKVVTYTIGMSENVTVNTAGGSPTLALNDGGTATYTSGSGTSTLTFSYTVAAGQNTPDLKVAGVNLNGATILDGAGNTANLSLAGLTQGSPQIDTTAPTVSAVAESPASGDLDAGKTVTLTLTMSENVTVSTAGGKPTLTLNDGATATYVSGSGTSALTFSYTVAAGQNIAALAATAVNPNGATILDGAGNAANLSLTGLTQAGPQIDTVAPSAPVISSDVVSTNVVTLTGTAAASSTVTVFNGTTQLGMATVNSSGAWSFATGSLANGNYSFTATDTDAAGNISAASSPLNVTVNAAPVNLVTNGTFETDNFSGWTLGGNSTSTRWGPEIFITSQAESGSYAAAMGSVGSNGTLSQTLQTTAGQQYTLSFWLANDGGGPNDFTATWNGTPVLALTNAPGQRYTEYTYIVTATGSTSTLEFAAEQNPTQWNLDNVSVTAGVNAAPGTTLTSSVSTAGPATIGTGATLELAAANSGSVTFLGSTGTLRLDHSSTFTGKISNFTGNGTLSGSDQIDLKDVKYSSVHDSYANGVLTVTDGTDTAKLTFNGSYTLANFKLANDGSGGTIVYDPPAPTPSSQNIAASGSPIGEATSSFMFSPNVALLGNYIASAFAEANDGHNGNLLATEASSPSDQSLLSNPHHA